MTAQNILILSTMVFLTVQYHITYLNPGTKVGSRTRVSVVFRRRTLLELSFDCGAGYSKLLNGRHLLYREYLQN